MLLRVPQRQLTQTELVCFIARLASEKVPQAAGAAAVA
jgi:hypothetical protein